MVNAKVSDLFEGGGAIVVPSSVPATKLEYSEVVALFEDRGAVLFRHSGLEPEDFGSFTDLYTESYSNDANRRGIRFNQKIIRNVDLGTGAMSLHSEGSFSPAWPEIIWFFCVKPPLKGGATTICDGVRIWEALSSKTKNFFLLNPLRFELEVPIEKKVSAKGKRPWVFNCMGAGDAFIDWDISRVSLTQIRPGVTEGRVGGQLCFCNHLLADYEPEILKRSSIDGSEVSAAIVEEIKAVCERLTHEIAWQAGDILMLDNRRFMHGRRAYNEGDPRDIVIVQTAKAAFGYGVTTRSRIRSSVLEDTSKPESAPVR